MSQIRNIYSITRRKIILIILFFSVVIHCFPQMINNEKANILTEEPFFNSSFVKSASLKSIVGTISTKKELGVIKSSGRKISYMFNKNGKLACRYTTNYRKDSNFIFYEYKSDKLMVKRHSDSYGFYSYSYEYNDNGYQKNQVYSREKNASKGKINFTLKEKLVVFKEFYKYSVSDTVVVKTCLNSNGRPYQEVIFYYDKLGYLKESSSRLLINNEFQKEVYKYNERGFLKSVDFFKGNIESPYKGVKYNYDEFGNVTFIDEYKNQERVVHKELLYNPSNFILKTILSQDLVTNLITITKFKPKFYN